ncbi:hypothetical protein B296_00047444 [Ensete ventricosum]|uniref:Uncharacterized protein n=1 Tax=Ensete ventricosum TaxID=4639 RepID=A0A426YS63_ENSVE|nr:hypothetical protein B296_00047444 [Ensete ventricosum]
MEAYKLWVRKNKEAVQFLESLAFVRLAAFCDSGYKMLLQGGETVNVDERQAAPQVHNGWIGDAREPGGCNGPGYIHDYHGSIPKSLEGRAISALSRFGENAKMVSDPMSYWYHPCLNFYADKLVELVVGVQTRYTYISGS